MTGLRLLDPPRLVVVRRDDRWCAGELRASRRDRDRDGWLGYVRYATSPGMRHLEWVEADRLRPQGRPSRGPVTGRVVVAHGVPPLGARFAQLKTASLVALDRPPSVPSHLATKCSEHVISPASRADRAPRHFQTRVPVPLVTSPGRTLGTPSVLDEVMRVPVPAKAGFR